MRPRRHEPAHRRHHPAQRRPRRSPARQRPARSPGRRPSWWRRPRRALSWRDGETRQQAALLRWKARNLLGVMARDVLGAADVATVGARHHRRGRGRPRGRPRGRAPDGAVRRHRPRTLRRRRAVVRQRPRPRVRLRGHRRPTTTSRASGSPSALRRFLQGATPATRLWAIDVDLRPEGKQGLLARSVEGYRRYFDRVGARCGSARRCCGPDPWPATPAWPAAFMDVLDEHVWEPRSVGRRRPGDPPDEGPHRARAHPGRRGPAVPPQARPRLAVRRRVDGAAAAAAPRRPGHRAPWTPSTAWPRPAC